MSTRIKCDTIAVWGTSGAFIKHPLWLLSWEELSNGVVYGVRLPVLQFPTGPRGIPIEEPRRLRLLQHLGTHRSHTLGVATPMSMHPSQVCTHTA